MTTRSCPSLSLCTAMVVFAGATSFAAPAVAQGVDLLAVVPLPGGCPGGPSLSGVVAFANVTLTVTTAPCEFGPVIAVFGFDVQLLAPPALLPWGCGPGPCELNLLPVYTVYTVGFPPSVSYTFVLPNVILGHVYAQSLVIGNYWSLSNPVEI